MAKEGRGARTRWVYAAGIAAVFVLAAGAFLLAPLVSERTYVDPGHRFSFHSPAGATVQDFASTPGGIETLQVSRSPSVATQITIARWPNATAAKAALLHSYPWLVSNTTTPAVVGGAAGIAFKDTVSGDENVWFAHGGYRKRSDLGPPRSDHGTLL